MRCTVGNTFTRISLADAFYVQRVLCNGERDREREKEYEENLVCYLCCPLKVRTPVLGSQEA